MVVINIVLIFVFFAFIINNRPEKSEKLQKTIDIQQQLFDAIEKTSDIVVQITTEDATTYYQEDSYQKDDLIGKQTIQRKGNWIIISKKWYILTNSHVVDNSNLTYTVTTTDNKSFIVKKIWKDELLDLAILFVDAKNLHSEANFIDIDTVIDVWTFVFAIGNPLSEYPNTVSFWIISGKWRNLHTVSSDNDYYVWFYQTDVALNPGNSWWPLINLSWEVIAMITAISRWGNNIWFALPLNSLFIANTLDILQKHQTLIRPYMWISYKNTDNWAIIDTIYQDSPVQGKIVIGDVILAIDNHTLSLSTPLLYYLYGYKPNDTIILKVLRDDRIISIPVVLSQKTL